MRPLPVVPLPQTDELLSSWLHRVAGYYLTSTEHLLAHITSREIDPRSLDDDPAPEDLLAIAAMLHTDSSLLLDRTFAKTPAPIRSFVSLSGRRRVCRTCAKEFWSSGMRTAFLREWCIALATDCRRCNCPMTRWDLHQKSWPDRSEAEWVQQRAFEICAALQPSLKQPEHAAALNRIMTALATPVPVPPRGRRPKRDRPALYRSSLYRDVTHRRMDVADPSRPFASWGASAQIAALCFVGEVAYDQTFWEDLIEFDLIDSDDPQVLQALLAPARAEYVAQ